MKIRIHPEKLRPGWDTLGFALDLLMITLVIVNLGLIIFDWIFAVPVVQGLFEQYTPGFFQLYHDSIHSHFLYYDLGFVAVYLTEFTFRWGVAIYRGTYHRWFFFPFIHWYDLLGCIPVAGFRWLRILRVVSLLIRLQRMGIVDLRETYLGKTLIKYYNILLEELSDRIVTNVLEGVQRQVRTGNPLVHRIENDVLVPRKQPLVDYLAQRIAESVRETHERYRAELGQYLFYLSDEAIARTDAGARLAAMPVAGPRAIALIGETVRELGTALTDEVVDDITNPDYRERLDELLTMVITQAGGDRAELNELVQSTTLDILEQVKAEVNVKQWKLAEEAERRGDRANSLASG